MRGAKQRKRVKMLNHLSITELSSVAYNNVSVKFLLWIIYAPGYSVDYIHKNYESDIIVTILYSGLVQLINYFLKQNHLDLLPRLCVIRLWGIKQCVASGKGCWHF